MSRQRSQAAERTKTLFMRMPIEFSEQQRRAEHAYREALYRRIFNNRFSAGQRHAIELFFKSGCSQVSTELPAIQSRWNSSQQGWRGNPPHFSPTTTRHRYDSLYRVARWSFPREKQRMCDGLKRRFERSGANWRPIDYAAAASNENVVQHDQARARRRLVQREYNARRRQRMRQQAQQQAQQAQQQAPPGPSTGSISPAQSVSATQNRSHAPENAWESVLAEAVSSMSPEDREALVGIDGHYLHAASWYQLWKTQYEQGLPVFNPVNPSYHLTRADFDKIMRRYRRHVDRHAVRPRVIPLQRIQNEYTLRFEEHDGFFKIDLLHNNAMFEPLGYIPSNIEADQSGSLDTTSSIMAYKIQNLFDRGRLTSQPGVCCTVPLKRSREYWQTDTLSKFRELMEQINDQGFR